ncbi:MAG TPA: succinate dehydrogenase, hydrophobic membrane anchor protein [Gammaproteobacteria bacterium]|jgi:succinate dehydrogenase / fumarate reductase membrane anchor subunit|nr:succinate dehydrogenase, hydrophobic membrane anchor protein [Gammaproteobacteria bacterium]
MNSNSLRSPLGKVKGLGSAKSGTEHFMVQRLTALALIPLTVWFCFSLAAMPQMDFETFTAWLRSPISASLMILTIIMTFYHAYLGLQVVIEDYVSDHAVRLAAIIAIQFICILVSVIGLVSVVKIIVGGPA